jgi:hypothetical protein
MEPDRRQRWLLGLLAVLAVIAAVYWLWPGPAASVPAPSNTRAAGRGGAATPAAATAPDVHLDALGAERPRPGNTERNPFRFRPKAPPPAPPVATRPTPPPIDAAATPPTPSVPPITLKYIGVIAVERSGKKIAGLSDGREVWHGSEGDVILGQYKILRIGTESIEMSYIDGRGRQTIRLSGS